VCFLVLSSLLTKFILKIMWLLVHWLEPIYLMDLVFMPMYLGCIKGTGMDHKHQDQNQAIRASKVKIRRKQLLITDLTRQHTGFPTKTDCRLTTQYLPWHHSQSATLFSSNDGPSLQQCWATSPSKTTSPFPGSWEVSSGIWAQFHRKLLRIWASRIAFSPD